MHHTILFKNLHSNFVYIPYTTKLPFSDSASLLLDSSFTYKPLPATINSPHTKNYPKMTITLGSAPQNNLIPRSVFLQAPDTEASEAQPESNTPTLPTPGYSAETTQLPTRSAPTASGIFTAASHINKDKTPTQSGQVPKQAYSHISCPRHWKPGATTGPMHKRDPLPQSRPHTYATW